MYKEGYLRLKRKKHSFNLRDENYITDALNLAMLGFIELVLQRLSLPSQ